MTTTRARLAALVALAATVAAAIAGCWVAWRTRSTTTPDGVDGGPGAGFYVWCTAFSVAGWVVASRRSSNPVGWLFLASGLSWALFGVTGGYRVLDLYTTAGVGGGRWAAWAWDWAWVVPVALIPLTLLVFPDGRLPSRFWRLVAGVLATGATMLVVALVLRPGPLSSTPDVENPVGSGAEGALSAVETVGNLAVTAGFVGAIASVIVRWRRAQPVERQQLRWLALAAVVIALAWITATVVEAVRADIDTGNIRTIPLVLLPASMAIAVLRYRLYDIDLVISKTVVYGSLTAVVGGLYAAIVGGLGALVADPERPTGALSVGAAAVVALIFQPARSRLQHVANRLVYGSRATPYEVLATFTDKIADVPLAENALDRMVEVIATGSGAAAAEVWVHERGPLSLAARWPPGSADPTATTTANDLETLDVLRQGADACYPIRLQDRLLGAITVTKQPGERLRPAEQRLLADLAAAAGLVLENVELVDELRASRQRLVTAQDGERRRIERNLHDGAQQRLLEIGLTLRLAGDDARRAGADDAAATLDGAAAQLRAALDELRELARGIHPAILTERGLAPALESLAERAAVPVTLETDLPARLPAAVEATAYFVSAEALANTMKHATASNVTMTARSDGRVLRLEVGDDGVGGARRDGPGLSGLADRVAALGGRLTLDSPAGAGTRMTAELPCA